MKTSWIKVHIIYFLMLFSFMVFIPFFSGGHSVIKASSAFAQPAATPTFTGYGPYTKCNPSDPQKDDLRCLVQETLDMVVFAVGPIVVVMIILSGIFYMTSMGNPTQVELAKKTLVGSIIGLIIVLLAYTIVQLTSALFQ